MAAGYEKKDFEQKKGISASDVRKDSSTRFLHSNHRK
jgi:hypothetical protein